MGEAIKVRNAWKSFDSRKQQPVLRGLNMTVQRGTIYGLLGASGCGKTTMLSCIVGTRTVDTGTVSVLGEDPQVLPCRSIGYMPQEVALYNQLTIKETFEYFGRLYDLSEKEISERTATQLSFLDLPSKDRFVGTLSGGQRRRTSLGISLMHEPQILILDEPTVGVDPLLREKIWHRLFELVQKMQTTVIITTHYIEEARHSHMVGLMRHGRLLEENSPSALLLQYNMTLLQDIVLTLCQRDSQRKGSDCDSEEGSIGNSSENSYPALTSSRGKSSWLPQTLQRSLKVETEGVIKNDDGVDGIGFKILDGETAVQIEKDRNFVANNNNCLKNETPNVLGNPRKRTKGGVSLKFSHVKALALKNWRLIERAPLLLVVAFLMPPLNILVVESVIGKEPRNLRLGVVVPDAKFNTDNCHHSSDVPRSCEFLNDLSCRFVNTLSNGVITLISSPSSAAALEDVDQGKTWGFIEVPEWYSNYTVQRQVEGLFPSNETLLGSTLSVSMDMSHALVRLMLERAMYLSYQKFAMELLDDCGDESRKADLPLNFRQPVYGHLDDDNGYTKLIVLGVIPFLLFFVPSIPSALATITDRKAGTLERSRVAGADVLESIFGYLIVNVALVLTCTTILYIQIVYLHQVQIQGSHFTFFFLTFASGFGGIAFSSFFAEIMDEEWEGILVGVSCFINTLTVAGIVWPIEAFPSWLYFISYSLPFTWTISSIRSVVLRGWSLFHPQVWPGVAIILVWSFLFFVASFILARRVGKK